MDLFEDLFIFEMANNHQGSVAHGIGIIREMGRIVRENHIRAALKLQYRDLETFIHKDFKGNAEVKHIKRFEETRLTQEGFHRLVQAIQDEGMITMCTPFDEAGVDWCQSQGIDIIKIASCSSCLLYPYDDADD